MDQIQKSTVGQFMLKNQIKNILTIRESLHENDHINITNCWNELTSALTKNKDETLLFLENASEEEIFWISEVFEDVAAVLQSQDYIDCLRFLEKKYPNLKLKSFVDDAYNWSNLE